MAAGVTKIADVVVPEIFTPYAQQITEEKSRVIQSGMLSRDGAIDALMVGGGLTYNTPSFRDLDNDAENVSTDNEASLSTPNKIGSSTEISVKLNRNNSWSTMDLTGDLAGADPLAAIGSRVGEYWARRLQVAVVAVMTGLFADNAAAPTGTDTHVQDDMTVDISGVGYTAGVTDFSAEAFIDAATTLGDSAGDVTMVMVHSLVYARMQKNNLIDFIPDARGETTIPTFLGRQVVVDDGLPATGGVFESWLFGAAALRLGVGTPDVATENDRIPAAGDGGGQDVLHNRVQWVIHPAGHAYIGSTPSGGPANSVLDDAASWSRVFPERKQIKIARLVTREF
jgi:hypothetical protein